MKIETTEILNLQWFDKFQILFVFSDIELS